AEVELQLGRLLRRDRAARRARADARFEGSRRPPAVVHARGVRRVRQGCEGGRVRPPRGGRVMAVPEPHWTWLHGPVDRPYPRAANGVALSFAQRWQPKCEEMLWDLWMNQPLTPLRPAEREEQAA